MGCCLSRSKQETITQDDPKRQMTELLNDDKIKYILTQTESKNLIADQSYETDAPAGGNMDFKDYEDNLDIKMAQSENNLNLDQITQSKPTRNKFTPKLRKSSSEADRFENFSIMTEFSDARNQLKPEAFGVTQVENEDNKLDIVFKLINFEFICDNFLEIFRMQFNPFFEINFKNYNRTYNNLIRNENRENSQNTSSQQNLQNESSANNVEPSMVDLINNSVNLNSNLNSYMSSSHQNNFSKLNEPFIEFVFNNSEEIETFNEFNVKSFFKREIYNHIHFVLMNKTRDDAISENPLQIGEAFLPVNYLFICPKMKDFHIKIPIRNTIEDLIIGYLNILVTDRDSELNSVNTMDPEVAQHKITNFLFSKNIQNLNDIDPNLLEKNFRGYKVYDLKKNNLFHLKFTENNIQNSQAFYTHLMNLQFNQIDKLIYTDKKDKIYNMKIFNTFNYYTFITCLNQIFGKLKGWDKSDEKSEIIIERLKKIGKSFFNVQYFQFNVTNDTLGLNILLVNNILTLFNTIKKENYVENFADHNLKESYSIKNIFSQFGIIYQKIVKKIPNQTSLNNNNENEFFICKNIQNNFLSLINLILEEYLNIGMNYDNKNSLVIFKQFFLEEIESLKINIKNHFLKDSEKFFFDPNYILGILKILINFIKFVKIFCYANKFSHNDVYIHEYIFNDTSLFIWLFTIFDRFIYDPRFYPMFLEFIYEFSHEVKGVYFIEFKKYFELPLFTMNFVPYLQELNKNNLLVWFFTSNIFYKYSQFVKNEQFQFLDFIGLSNKESQILIQNQFNMLVVLVKDDYVNFRNLRFKEELDTLSNLNIVDKNTKITYTHFILTLVTKKNKKTKFLISSFHLKLLSNIFATISNLIYNNSQFLTFINKNTTTYQMFIKLINILVLINFESDKNLNSYFNKNKNLFFILYDKILNFTRQLVKNRQLKLNFISGLENSLIELIPKIDMSLLDKKTVWANFKENLKIKIESSIVIQGSIPNKNNNKMIEKLEKLFDELDLD